MTFENLKNKLNEEELVKAINFLMECVVSQNPENGQKFIEEEMLKNNISPNEFTLSIWMKAYCNKGKPEKAEKILRNASKYNINHVNEYLYNMLIDAFGRKRKVKDCLRLFEEMKMNGLTPNVLTYTSLINAFMKVGNLKRVIELFNQMKLNGMKPNVVSYNNLIDRFAKKGDLNNAIEIFNQMRLDGIIPFKTTYNNLIDGYVKKGDMDSVMKVFDQMKNIRPDVFTYSRIINGYCKLGDMDNAIKLFNQMKMNEIKPNVVTYNSLIDGYAKKGDLNKAIELFNQMEMNGIKHDTITYNILINALGKAGRLDEAERVLQNMKNPDEFTWITLLHACKMHSDILRAERIFEMLKKYEGVKPNLIKTANDWIEMMRKKQNFSSDEKSTQKNFDEVIYQ